MSDSDITIGGDSVDIPAGTYPAKVSTISVKESAAYGEFRAWDFELDNGSTVGGATSMATGSKSKGGTWIRNLLGRKPTKGETVKLAGLPCMVVVAEDGNGWPKVTDVLPPMGVQPVASAAQPAQDDEIGNLPF